MLMNAAPAWVTYVSLAVAIFAALVAAGSLAVSYLNHRAGSHRTKVHALVLGDTLLVRVVNKGRGPVDVTMLDLAVPFSVAHLDIGLNHLRTSGPELEYRLEGYSVETWKFDLKKADPFKLDRRLGWQVRVYGALFRRSCWVKVSLAGGEVRSRLPRVQREGVVQLLRRAGEPQVVRAPL